MARRRLLTTARALAVAGPVLVTGLAAAPALAHDYVVRTSPAPGSSVPRAKATLASVTFGQPFQRGTLVVKAAATGRLASIGSGAKAKADVRRLQTRLRSGLRAGRYVARWSVVAADGHRQTGTFAFRLR